MRGEKCLYLFGRSSNLVDGNLDWLPEFLNLEQCFYLRGKVLPQRLV